VKSTSGTFADNRRLPVHNWFGYTAGFSADWVTQVVTDHNPTLVYDPFAGCGTTVFAAQLAGFASLGCESHPFVVRVARAKLGWSASRSILERTAAKLLVLSHRFKQPLPPVAPLLAKCYTPTVLVDLLALRDAWWHYHKQLDPVISRLVWLALVGILRTCSCVGTAQCQYVLPNQRKANQVTVAAAWEHKIARMVSDMHHLRHHPSTPAHFFRGDARRVPQQVAPRSVDLVITSSPYINNFDYADATRLEMTFFNQVSSWGELHHAVRRHLLCSCSQHAAAEHFKLDKLLQHRATAPIARELAHVCHQLDTERVLHGGRKTYHTMVAAYFVDMSRVLRSLRVLTKRHAAVCLVIGDSAPYGIHVPVPEWLQKLAEFNGFEFDRFEKLRDRNTKWKCRKHRVPLLEGQLWLRG